MGATLFLVLESALIICGDVAERLMATVFKTVEGARNTFREFESLRLRSFEL